MTPLEQHVYNSWLATTRSQCNKPFKLRKKWDGFEDKIEYLHVKKLAKLFNRYDNIDISEWFKAPYVIYNEKVQYDLKYYTLMKSYTTYKLFLQKKHNKQYTPQEFKQILNKKKLTNTK